MAGATRLQSVTISVRAASHTTLTSAKNRRRSKQRRRFSSEMTDKNDKSKVDLGLLEEDDEFEEFPAEGESKLIKRNSYLYFTQILT